MARRARDLDALQHVLRDLVAVAEAVEVQFTGRSFAEAPLLFIKIVGLDELLILGLRVVGLL